MIRTLVSVEELAEIFDKDVRTIQLWVSREGMPKEDRGRYDLAACAMWRNLFLENKLKIAEQSKDDKLHSLKIKDTNLSIQAKELKYKRLAGSLVDYDAARLAWLDETTRFRKALTSVIYKLTDALEGVDDRNKRLNVIMNIVYGVQKDLGELKVVESEELEEENDLDNDNDLPEDPETI